MVLCVVDCGVVVRQAIVLCICSTVSYWWVCIFWRARCSFFVVVLFFGILTARGVGRVAGGMAVGILWSPVV